jgi:hypothetical protein
VPYLIWNGIVLALHSVEVSQTGSTVTVTPGVQAEVTVEQRKGWIQFRIEHQGQPVPGALVEIWDDSQSKFAEGTTGTNGEGQFPMPTTRQFKMEVKIQDKSANSILLTRIDDEIVPKRTLLAYGTKPCCKVPRLGLDESEASSWSVDFFPAWAQMSGIALVLCGGFLFSLLFKRPHPSKK